MARKHRSFRPSSQKARDIGFALLDQEFECLPYIPATASATLANPAGDAIIQFLEGCLIDNDVLRFRNILNSKDTVVPMDTLIDIVNFLVEEYIGTPLAESSNSSNGAEPTVRLSTASSD